MIVVNEGRAKKRQVEFIAVLLLIAISSLGLAGCAGLVSASKTSSDGTPVVPTISTEPTSQTVTAGQNATFSVAATGTAPLSYKWIKNNAAIAGATSASYTTPATTSADNGSQFAVVVTNAAGSMTSSTATLTVTAAAVVPSITAQPLGETVTTGQTATFNVVATGTAPLSYQWKKNNTAIAGATAVSYTTPATTSADNGSQFVVVVSDSAGNTTSNMATLTVTAAAVAPSITTQPASQTVTAGQTATFSVAATGTAPLSYQWMKNNTAIAGATAASYTTPATTSAANGSQFAVVVTNTAGSMTSSTATLTVSAAAVAPSITAQPVSQTVTVGQTATFSVVATGTAPLSYQWMKNSTAIAGATAASYTTPATTSAANGSQFAVVVTNTAGSMTSSTATLTVNSSATLPGVPTGLTATAVSSSEIDLSWTASTGTVTGYNVYRSGNQIGTSTTTTYADTGLTASTSYSYTVAAHDSLGDTSAQSASATATTAAASSGGGIPSALGWYEIPNTTLAPNCPNDASIQANTGCGAVISAWGGAAADTTLNRMIIWGGGHQDYYGNEVYALNLNANPIAMTRITNPSTFNGACTDAQSDGNPTSRHTYAALTYMPTVNKMYAYSGARANCGYADPDTWTFNLSNFTWLRQDPTTGGPPEACSGCVTDWDPNVNLVYNLVVDGEDLGTFWSYNPANNAYTELQSNGIGLNLNLGGGLDPGRELFFGVGNGAFVKVDISSGSSHVLQDISGSTTGCSSLISANSPGFAYDPVQKLMVGWVGGNSAILFDPDTNTCTSITYANGPGTAQGNGTFGRFRYFPAFGVFIVVNDWEENAYSLRLTAASGGGSGSGPNISNVGATAITTTGVTIGWTTDVTATSQVEYGPTTAYGTLTTVNSTLVTAHSVAITGLTSNTLYHYRVHSSNSAGTASVSSDYSFQTNNTTNTQPPTVTITAPTNGATISGTFTLTGTATDSVGVTSFQFLLDGSAVGSALTAAPYTYALDTTTLANGSHTVSAKASDAAGNIGTAVAVTVTVSNTGVTPAMQDFEARCSAAGVIVCQGFDDPSVLTPPTWPASGLYPGDTNDTSLVSLDSTIAVSGSSLKFTIPGLASADPAGYWRQLFNGTLTNGPTEAHVFGQNSTFYVQFRQRFDPNFLNNEATAQGNAAGTGGTTWKQSILSNDTATCANEEMTLVNHPTGLPLPEYPVMYSQCGQDNFQIALPNYDYLNEQGANTTDISYNCHYQAVNNVTGSCFNYPSDTWITFYIEANIGTWGEPNSSVQAWVALPGQPFVQFVNITNHTLLQDTGSPGYDMVTLIPYWSFRDPTISAGPTSYTWYDELIVSAQPIALPKY